MVKHNQSPTPHQQSRKFRSRPLKGPSIEVADFVDESGVQISRTDKKHASKKFNAQSSEILSTPELISAVGQIWDCASRSLTRFQPSAGPNCSDTINQKGNKKIYLVGDDNRVALDVIDSECSHVLLNSSSYVPSIVQQSLERMRMTHKIRYRPCEDHYIQNFVPGSGCNISAENHTLSREKSLADDVGITYDLMNRYRWRSQIHLQGDHSMSTSRETMNIFRSFMPDAAVSVCYPLSGTEEILSRDSETICLGQCPDASDMKDQFSSGKLAEIKNRNLSMFSQYSNYILQVAQNTHHSASMFNAHSLAMKSYASSSEPGCSHEAEHHQTEHNDLVEDSMLQSKDSNIDNESQSKSSLPVMNRPHPLLAKQEHAVSGALSGIVVSLCLHPVDTVKTVLQSSQAGQKSLCYIGQSIVAERGLSGLYRGVSSNLTTSAPISALYTFTYESVKGFLLPSLAKEYHSIAHCTAGGCASIATSFIFTPSDHIKQQMQVNSKYQNCWNAALRIIEKGGLLSLYAGWGAVLCRNIPHSIIKFYTYESLKQMFVSSELPDNQPSTSQTLLCGGLAGSAAALFSTPFDVVKTRLQTQMPGSATKNRNILNALHQIRDQEGVKGLYRGLIPRLIMYMSQGALFFASYEFFKSLLSLDFPRDSAEMLQYKQDVDDDTLLPV
ncbi:hypothetical protein RND81_06G243400 [Saponaria officinalis]